MQTITETRRQLLISAYARVLASEAVEVQACRHLYGERDRRRLASHLRTIRLATRDIERALKESKVAP